MDQSQPTWRTELCRIRYWSVTKADSSYSWVFHPIGTYVSFLVLVVSVTFWTVPSLLVKVCFLWSFTTLVLVSFELGCSQSYFSETHTSKQRQMQQSAANKKTGQISNATSPKQWQWGIRARTRMKNTVVGIIFHSVSWPGVEDLKDIFQSILEIERL